jgi:preprotein translocase subunit SecA
MFKNILSHVAGNPYERELSRYKEIVHAVNQLEAHMQSLSDDDLRALTDDFRARLAQGATLEEVLPEAFAAVREASRRTIDLRPFDVQIIGGVVLHEGKIAEMKTGEGKTLVATLPLYLNALTGDGAHLVTVNDYLARRDGGWMGKIYHALGLSVGVIGKESFSAIFDPDYVDPGGDLEDERLVHWQPASRREAYLADVTYGTASEFGFDYLRDNIAIDLSQIVQRGHPYAIVDEVDSILIDGARTPLIISGPAGAPAREYARFAQILRGMKRNTSDLEFEPPNGHYAIDERTQTITLTEKGIEHVERQLPEINLEAGESVYDPKFYDLVHYLDNALKAEYIFKRDKEYVVQDGRVILVDQTTGRPMPSRRYSEGLHQAIEAKEGVTVRREDVTVATITIQNYFRMYTKLAGMTGTAVTQAEEFDEVYSLDVIAIPTNIEYRAQEGELGTHTRKEGGVEITTYRYPDGPDEDAFFRRVDWPDVVYKDENAKFEAAVHEIEELRQLGRPMLVGTASVEASERLSGKLKARGIPHSVLNAKHHQKEALTVAQAGQPGAVTISTNMAGRGTDILLGGNPEGLAAQHVERVLFGESDLYTLVERYFEGGIDAARRWAEATDGLDPELAAWVVQTDAHYRAVVETIEQKGLWHAIADGLQADWNAPFEHLVALVRHLGEGRTDRAEALVGQGAVPAGALVDAGRRAGEYFACQRAYQGDKQTEFLSERLFEAHYNARAALIRATLSGDLDEAHRLAEVTPGLPESLIGEIQAIQRKCQEDRQRIWEAGGLHVLGTERHEARRIDNQLRGRAARQGDPGSSRFYLSLDDELMRRFGGDRVRGFMDWADIPDDEPITAGMLTKAIETAQNRFEGYNFDIRKSLVEYDEAVNLQRQLVYDERHAILEGQGIDLDAKIREFFEEEFQALIERYLDGYLDWVEGEISSAVIDFSDLESGQVNALGVVRRVQSLLPRMARDDLQALIEMDDETALGEELMALAHEGQESGHHIRLLIGQIARIMPLWPGLPDVIRASAQAQPYIQAVRATFEGYAEGLSVKEQQVIWEPLEDGLSRAFREVALAVQTGKTDGGHDLVGEFTRNVNDVLLEASHQLLSRLEPDDLLAALLAQVNRLLDLWRNDPSVGIGDEDMLDFERALLLSAIDSEWRQYLTAIDDLRQGIGLEAFGQRDPKVEFKRRVFEMFDELRDNVRQTVARSFFRELPRHRQIIEAKRREEAMLDSLGQSGYRAERQRSGQVTLHREMWDVGRNDLCPCGSGKKFKNCHYKQVQQQQQTVSQETVHRSTGGGRRRRRH